MNGLRNVSIVILLFFFFTVLAGCSKGQQNNNSYKDSTSQNNLQKNNQGNRMNGGQMRGNSRGRGMMGNGSMMGNGGMMGQSALKNIKTDKNGNWIAPSSADNFKNPLKDISEASIKGKNIFNSQCFTCHGTDGKGDGPAAISLNPKPANLTSKSVQNQSDGAIFWKITNGNSPMPSFSGLSKNQRWELVDYIRQLGK